MSDFAARVLVDPELRHREFPVTRSSAFFAHAAVAPLPRAVAAAIHAYLEDVQHVGQFDFVDRGVEAETRELAAELLNVSPQEIALSPSTSASLGLIAAGLDWKVGDHVVVLEHDFPSNVMPWLGLRSRGVTVDAVPYRHQPVECEEVLHAVGPRTRLVAVSTAHFTTGRPMADLTALSAELRRRGVLVAVDAIQTAGAMPIDASQVDFLACDGHKWLLAPKGMGVLVVRKEIVPQMRVPLVGWHSMEDPKRYDGVGSLTTTARRFEPGSLNILGLIGLHSALRLLRSAGIQSVSARLSAVRHRLATCLAERGYEVPGLGVEQWSGITAFRRVGADANDLARSLQAQRIVVSVRAVGQGAPYVRVAPHFYTSDDDVAQLIDAV